MSELKPNHHTQFQPGNKFSRGRPKGSKNVPRPITKEQLLKDIQVIYQRACKYKQWNVALHAKAWQGKLIGLLRTRKLPNITKIRDMSEGELEDFLARLEESDPSLKTLELSQEDK